MGYGGGAEVAIEDQRALLTLPRSDGGGDEEAARGRAIRAVPKSSALVRINAGLVLFAVALFVVPVMDAAYVKGVRGRYAAYDVTVAVVLLSGIADVLVQGGVIEAAGELPERYMQAVVAGTAASGTHSFLIIFFDL